MSDTNVQECNCCQTETDCISGLCEPCSNYNYKLQKQSDLLTLGLLQEKRLAVKLYNSIDGLLRLCKDVTASAIFLPEIKEADKLLGERNV